MQRRETRVRARALQLLYAWEVQGRPALEGVARAVPLEAGVGERHRAAAERLAIAVAEQVDALDRDITDAMEHWRLERVGLVERNILRLGLYELQHADLPPPVAITEAVKLARWFAGPKAPAFVNGVLDALARRLGRL